MKKKLLTVIVLVLAAAVTIAAVVFIIPYVHEKACKERVYDDMEAGLDTVRDSVIGIIPKTEKAGEITYGGGGSGVIFEQRGNIYYAVTAAHCVSDTESTFKIYTTATSMETVEGLGKAGELLNIMDDTFYKSLLDASIEYISDSSDLAIISFISDDTLATAQISKNEPQVGDRLMCVGNPECDRFIVTYGKVTKKAKIITGVTKNDDNSAIQYRAAEHNAYIYFGNSGGPAFGENMSVVGINTAGSISLLGMFKSGEMVPCTDVLKCIAEWKSENF